MEFARRLDGEVVVARGVRRRDREQQRPAPRPRGATARQPRQQAAQRKGDDEIDERERQRRAEQARAGNRPRCRPRIAFLRHARRQRRQRRESLDRRREVERAARIARCRRSRADGAPRRASRRRPPAAIVSAEARRAGSRPNPSSVSTGGRALSEVPETPWLSATMRRSMLTNRPEMARFDHSGSAEVWTRMSQPLPRFAAVTSGVPSVSRAQVLPARSSVGSASTWRDTVTSAGMSSPAKGLAADQTAPAAPASPTTARRRACARRAAR